MGVSKQHKPNRSRKSRQSLDCILKALHWLRCFSCLDKVNSTCYQDRDGLSDRHIKKLQIQVSWSTENVRMCKICKIAWFILTHCHSITTSWFLSCLFHMFSKGLQSNYFHPAEISRQHFEYLKVLVRFTLSSGTELYLHGFKDGLLWHVFLFLFKKRASKGFILLAFRKSSCSIGEKKIFLFWTEKLGDLKINALSL